MRILSTLAVAKVLDALVPRHAGTAEVSINPTALILGRVKGGERGDLALLTDGGIDELCAAGILVPASRVGICVSEIGIAVQAGAAKPDISTSAAVRAALLAAKSIAYSKAGASGIFFAGLIERLGIADEVNRKATVIASGFTGALAADGRVELAIQQVSELMAVPGIDMAGPLPDDIQERLRFSGAVFAGAAHADAAAAFLQVLARPESAAVYRAAGLRPIDGPA
jgi:molybdate transport system substrate-binding protein